MNARILLSFSLLGLVACEGELADCKEASGTLCVFAGQPEVAMLSYDGEPARGNPLYLPQDMALGADGSAYLLDFNNHRIRKVAPDGLVQTIAGTGFLGDGPQGPALGAAFNHPTDLAFMPDDPNQLVVAAWHNSRIVIVDLARGEMRYHCGTGARSFSGDGGPALEAALDLPSSVAFDDEGALYISDQANQIVRRVDPEGTITTIAGRQREPGYSGDGGPALEAQLHASVGQAADPSSRLTVHDGTLYLADTDNHVIRAIDLASGVISLVAGAPEEPGFADGPAESARFDSPRDVEVGPDGALYVADTDNHCVRRIADGEVTTVIGVCGEAGSGRENKLATESLLHRPYGIELAADGRIFVADTHNHVFRVAYP